MEDLKAMIDGMVSIMKFEFNLWGFDLSFWNIMLSILIGGIVIWIIGEFFNG